MTNAHIIPTADLVRHEASDECVCGPASEPVKRTDGSVGWLTIHHALDGRDRFEATS